MSGARVPSVALLDYGGGNLRSVRRALEAAGASVRLAAAPREAEGAVVENTDDACEKHLQAILAANPNGFLAWSEKRVGLRGSAPCAPAFFPLRRAA